jgi:hypothetical protein
MHHFMKYFFSLPSPRRILTLTRELPMGLPPKSCKHVQSSYLSGDKIDESPVRTPLYPSKYIRMVRPEMAPDRRDAAQNSTRYATDEDRHGANPPEVIIATFICSGMVGSFCVGRVVAGWVLCGGGGMNETFVGDRGRRGNPGSDVMGTTPINGSSSHTIEQEGIFGSECQTRYLQMAYLGGINYFFPRPLLARLLIGLINNIISS